MSESYDSIDRRRAGFLADVSKITTSLIAFDVASGSLNFLEQLKQNLDASERGHVIVIDSLRRHQDADDDAIGDHQDEFQEAFDKANVMLKDAMDELKRFHSFGQMKDAIEGMMTRMRAIVTFKNAYSAEATTAEELQSRLDHLPALKERFEEAVDKLILGSDEATKAYIAERQTAFDAAYYTVAGWITKEIQLRAPPPPLQRSSLSTAAAEHAFPTTKLPKIELPKHDGAFANWVTFRDSFKSLIHDNPKLANVTKFRYLKSSITDVNSPINHLLENEDGYADAWAAVMLFYDDKRKILDGHISNMMTTKRMTGEHHDELQKIINEFTLHTASIERMFGKESLYDSIIAHLVIHRLDQHTRDLFETENQNAIPSWPTLKTFLEKRRKTLSTMPTVKAGKPPVILKPAMPSGRSTNVHAATTKPGSSSPSSPKSSSSHRTSRTQAVKCRLCNCDHRLYACSEFEALAAPERLQKVREMKLCENCLSPSHAIADCASKYACRHCHQRHHSLLHPELNSAAPPFQSRVSCNSVTAANNQITLLQTAIVKISDSRGSWHSVRALLDPGADSNFISTEVANVLNLKLRGTHVEANGLGGNHLTVIRHIVTTEISDDEAADSRLSLDFLVTPKITNPTPFAAVDRSALNIPSNIRLADPHFDVPGKIDILLGNNIYGQLMRHGRIELTSGIVLLNTIHGFVFSGSALPCPADRRNIMTTTVNHSTLGELKESIEKANVQEDYHRKEKFLTPEQTYCEENFEQRHTREPNPEVIVETPSNELAETFEQLKDLKIPRHLPVNSPKSIQLHCFCDSPDKGFSATIHTVSTDAVGQRKSHPVCAKSRVAPTIYLSTARLELGDAVLLANLMKRANEASSVRIDKQFCGSDSAIVLHWLKKMPAQLQTFVANRVNEVQELTVGMTWRHVRTHLKPADLISRGLLPGEMKSNRLWWHGPSFLLLHETQWPAPLVELNPDEPAYADEVKKMQTSVHVVSIAETPETNIFLKWMEDSSRTSVVKRKMAHLKRVLHNVRAKKAGKLRRSGPIDVADLVDAKLACIRICQQVHFKDETRLLLTGKCVSSSSSLKMLSPFLDQDLKIIRFGRRLDYVVSSEDQKHPMVLPNSHFTKVFMREIPERNLNTGQLATLAIARQKFCPIRGRQIVKQRIRQCIRCFRARPKMVSIEEFDQLDCKIEAILNSHPLTPLSKDPDDFTALTAGHFLIAHPLVSKPEHDLKSANINRTTRWQRFTHIQQHFWRRWSQEYLHQLQIRTKNYQDTTPVVEGQLVLLEVETQPPTSWPLGRITAIFPGKDGITRVARIKTPKSKFRAEKDDNYTHFTFNERPVTKIALLPTETEGNQL
jgi:hypothetical protein